MKKTIMISILLGSLTMTTSAKPVPDFSDLITWDETPYLDRKKNAQDNPKLSQYEVIEGFLNVVQSLKNGAELSPDLIYKDTGIRLNRDLDYKHRLDYDFANILAPNWTYGYGLYFISSNFPSFSVEILPEDHNYGGPRTLVCDYDFAKVDEELLKIGFEISGIEPARRSYRYENFTIIVNHHFQDDQNRDRRCIMDMIIYVKPTEDK